MRRILITGASGFIGRHLVQSLERLEYDVYTTSRRLDGDKNCKSDITSEETKEFISRISPNTLIHLAGILDVRQSHLRPMDYHKINTGGTLNVLSAMSKVPNSEIIYLNSGGAIYDSDQALPMSETSTLRPLSPYGVSKMAAEQYTSIICKNYGIDWTSLAISNCYGNFQASNSGVMWNFFNKIKCNDKAIIYGKDTSRDFVYIDDVINAILLAIGNPTNQRVNISSNVETKLIQTYLEIASKLKRSPNFVIADPLKNEVSRSQLDNSLGLQLLGWAPKVSIEDGIGLSIEQ
jgi:UDP-glucose 4-epimerase